MEALEVFALTADMHRATGSIPYTSLMWNRKYYECGDFLMEVPADVYDPSWAYVYTEERPETGIIQKVEYSDASQAAGGAGTVTLSGFFSEFWLNQYTFLVEQTEEEAYRIYRPTPAKTGEPTMWTDGEGNAYVKTGGSRGVPSQWETVDGEYVDPSTLDTASLEEIPLEAGEGMRLIEYPTDNTDRYPSGYWNAGEYSNSCYSYYSEDGKTLHSVAPDGTRKEFDMVCRSMGTAIYRDADNGYHWVNGVASSLSDTYVRELDSWQLKVRTEGLEVLRDEYGTYARAYRTVKGPWQLRTDLDVNEPADNVQRIIQWAQGIWGSNILYDEPGFEGESKIIDPSLKLFGDFCYEELKTVGASVRMFYSFPINACVFEVWRGLDRTQGQTGNPWAVFSAEWGTLSGFKASADSSNYRNKCYVLYRFRDKTDADGNPIGPRGYVEARLEDGMPDWETVLDLRGEEPSDSGQTDDAFIESLRQRGLAHLEANYALVESLETGTLDGGGYLADYDLGDKVDMAVEALGLLMEARITGACEVHEAGGSTVTIEIGEQKLTNLRKAAIM